MKLRERFLNLGLTLNDELAVRNMDYRQCIRDIADSNTILQDLEFEMQGL